MAEVSNGQNAPTLSLAGLVEETKRINEENKQSPKIAHESSVKAPTRISNTEKLAQANSNWVEYRTIGRGPERRGFHASFVHNDCLYIHGGHDIREGTLDTLWRLDFNKHDYDWEKLQTRGRKPGNIAYHTITVYSSNECVLIGGSDLGIDNKDIYKLNLHTLEWTLDKSARPSDLESIDEHTSCLVDDKIYVFGGNVHGFKSNKMYVLDVNSWKWTQLEHKKAPPPRSSHSAAVKDGIMYVFGGKDSENNKLADLWKYDIAKDTWSQVPIEDGDGPLSRSGHSSGVFKNYIIVYAGIHELTQELSDMYLFDTKTNNWSILFEEEHSPVHHNRSQHSSFSSANKRDGSPKNSDDNLSVSKLGSPGKSQGFSLNVQKTKHKKNRKSLNITSINQRSRLEKLIKKKRAMENVHKEESYLTTPTSLSMKNSFLISSIGKTLDNTFKKHKKRMEKLRSSFRHSSFAKVSDLNVSPTRRQTGKVSCFNPKPRDGHTGMMLNEDEYIIFGGDRHHMPFNDVASIDLSLEI